jgi:7-cyano-7-deazaguanine synthase
MKKAIVLCSGGMDSCLTTAIANQDYKLAALHLNYGQRTEKKELQAFNDIANHYKIEERLIIDTSFLKEIGGSSLTDEHIELASDQDVDRKEVPNSYVPFRNANILSMAVSWAEVIAAEKIFVGAVEEDSSGYPDCRVSFFQAFNKMIDLGTKPESNIEILTPIINLSKADIVKKAFEMNAPLHLTWSCYRSENLACGVCDSCLLRLRGFHKAGVTDPINYK